MRATSIISLSIFIAAAAPASWAFAQDEAKSGNAPMTYIPNASEMDIAPMEAEGVKAFLEDIVSSDDPEAPITCGLFRLEKGAEPLVYAYDYDEVKIMLDGEITVSDGMTTETATEGDVLYFPKGSNISFTTESSGLSFICGQRPRDGA